MVAFEGRHLTDSSMKEFSEVNIKIVSILLEAKKKKQLQKYVASVTHYFIPDMEDPKKERPTLGGAVNQFLSF